MSVLRTHTHTHSSHTNIPYAARHILTSPSRSHVNVRVHGRACTRKKPAECGRESCVDVFGLACGVENGARSHRGRMNCLNTCSLRLSYGVCMYASMPAYKSRNEDQTQTQNLGPTRLAQRQARKNIRLTFSARAYRKPQAVGVAKSREQTTHGDFRSCPSLQYKQSFAIHPPTQRTLTAAR